MSTVQEKMRRLGRAKPSVKPEQKEDETAKKMVRMIRKQDGKKVSDSDTDDKKNSDSDDDGVGSYLVKQKGGSSKDPKKKSESEHAPQAKPESDRHDIHGVLINEPIAPPHSASDMERFFKRKEYVHHPFGPPQIMLFTGPLGSGKSTAIYGVVSELLEILSEKSLGDVVYYSGSAGDRMLKAYGSKVYKYTPESEESFLTHIRSILAKSGEVKHEEKKRHIIVLDDAVARDFFPRTTKTASPVAQLLVSTRHIPASILISSQKLTDLPTFARSNSLNLFAWQSKSANERNALLNESATNKKLLENSIDTLQAGQFIWLDKTRGTINKGFNQNLIH